MSFGNEQPWMVEGESARQVLHRAWDLGINFFDTANVYSKGRSEEILGDFLQGMRREEVVVATKVFNPMGTGPNEKGLSRKHIFWQIQESLKRLKLDFVDLYQIHRWDYEAPVEETLSALTDIVRNGQALYIGASSMWAWQFAKSLYLSEMHGYEKFVSMQNLYNLIYREEEREMIPLCLSEKIAMIPWSPTAGGFLSGSYFVDGKITSSEKDSARVAPSSFTFKRYAGKPSNDEIVRRQIELAQNKGVKPAQIAIAWLLTKQVVASPIIGTTKLEHLEEFVGSLDVKITPEEAKYLEEPYVPQPVSGHS
jgi:1-deoxyxylulose-5-phosphate synthase